MAKKILCIFMLLLMATPAWARDWEYYVEYKTRVPLNKAKKVFFNLKEETRYKNGINYYRKTFFGVSKKLNSKLEVSLYYAFKEKRKNGWNNLDMFWPQLDYKINFKKLALASTTKLERHCYSNTYKFRQKLKVVFPIKKKFDFFIGDEGRLFSFFDNPYFGENEALCGFDVRLFKDFALEIYYDLRRIKSKGAWQNTNCLRTVLNLKF